MSFLSNLFSGKGPQINYQQGGFSSPGISSFTGPNGVGTGITESPELKNALSSTSNTFGQAADVFGGLRSDVMPGYNNLLQTRLTDLNNQATSAIGNLKQNLSARRILGSSFGNDTINRANVDYAQQRDKTIAENYLQSLDASSKLAQQEFSNRVSQFKTGLDQFNFEAGLAADISGKANSIMAANAKAQAELDAKAEAGAGSFLGGIIGKVAGPTLTGLGGSIASGFGFGGKPA